MTKDRWLQAAEKNDDLVAELLLRLKHSSDSDSLRAPPPPATSTVITTILPPCWGHRKNRSKSAAPITTAPIATAPITTASITTATTGFVKEHRRSPTTHLSWSGGGGGGSSSDGYEESSRPSDLSCGSRSVKANEISSYNKHEKSNKMRRIGKNDRQLGLPVVENRLKPESKGSQGGFSLPDLNIALDEGDFSMI